MRRLLLVILALAIVFWLARPAHAQYDRMLVNVPFDFIVGEKTLPAGQYFIWTEQARGQLCAEATEIPYQRSCIGAIDKEGPRPEKSQIIFTTKDGRNVLTAIRPSHYDHGHEVVIR